LLLDGRHAQDARTAGEIQAPRRTGTASGFDARGGRSAPGDYVARCALRGERGSSRDTQNPVWAGVANEQGHPHEGVMVFLDNELDPNTGTIHARGLFKNADRRFTPGMFARVKLIGSGQYDALLINDSAIGTDQSVKFVLRVGADNKIEYAPVKLGPLIDGLRVVRDGLKANDVIVVKGLQQVRPGMPVTPQLVAMGEPRRGGNTLVAQN